MAYMERVVILYRIGGWGTVSSFKGICKWIGHWGFDVWVGYHIRERSY